MLDDSENPKASKRGDTRQNNETERNAGQMVQINVNIQNLNIINSNSDAGADRSRSAQRGRDDEEAEVGPDQVNISVDSSEAMSATSNRAATSANKMNDSGPAPSN